MGVKAMTFNLVPKLLFDFIWNMEYLRSCGVASLLRVLLHDDVENRNAIGTFI